MEAMNLPSGTVTFLFTDIEGSTRLLEKLHEGYARVLSDQRHILRDGFARWNGHEIDTQGDSFFASFSRAVDALDFVIEAQRALASHAWPEGVSVQVRMGLHTGEPIILEGGGYIGMDVHQAARIAASAHGGQVLLSQTARDLVYQDLPKGVSIRDLGSFKLKDIRLPQQIFQVEIDGLPGDFPPLKTLSAIEEPPTPGEPPYKGLVSFEEGDAGWFFGREAATQALLQALQEQRFLAVIGASGSGKSSIVRAGLIPAFKRTHPAWQVILLTPTNHPLESLALSLTRGDRSVSATASLIDDLRADPRNLHLFLKKSLAHPGRGNGEHTGVLIAIDQFEELFTLCRDEAERQAFIDDLIYAVEHAGGPVSLVIALRADFYNRLAQYASLRQLVAHRQEYLGGMTAAELRQAIEEPARLGGWEFSPGLVDLMLHDIGASEGRTPEPGALPLLSHALLETWKRRRGNTMRLKSYAEAGGVRRAIARTAEAVYYGEFSPDQQHIARSIFLRLTEPGEGEQDTRRRATLSELVPAAGGSGEGQVTEVLNRLADTRLVTISEGNAEVAHEALIREWPALREWLSQDREGLRTHRRLTEAAIEWQRLDREPSALYRGARLAQALEWAQANPGELNQLEKEFLGASRLAIEQEEIEREAARQRELEAAQKLAQSEHQRAEERSQALQRQRKRAYLLAGALLVAAVLAALALQFARRSQASAVTAQNESFARVTQQAIAEAEADGRATQQAVAVAAQGEAEKLADLRLRDAQVNQSLALAAQSQLALQAENPDQALALAMEAVKIPDPPGQAQLALSDAAYGSGIIRLFLGHQAPVGSTAVSPDGRYGLTGDNKGVIYLWDLESGSVLRRLDGHTSWVTSLAFTPDGRQAISASRDGTLIHWDLEKGEAIRRLIGHEDEVNTVAVSPDGRLAASGSGRFIDPKSEPSKDNSLRLWDLHTGEEIRRLTTFSAPVIQLNFFPDGKRLAVGTAGDGFLVIDTQTDKVLTRLFDFNNPISESEISPDGHTALLHIGEPELQILNLETNEAIDLPVEQPCGVWGLAISPDGERGLKTGCIVLELDLQTQEEIRRFNFNANEIAYLPDGRSALAGSDDGIVRLLALASGAEIGRLPPGANNVRGLAYDPTSSRAAIVDTDSLSLWNLETGEEMWRKKENYGFWDVAFSPNGQQVLVGSYANTASLLDASTGELIWNLGDDGEGHPVDSWVDSVAFHPSGKFALTGSQTPEKNLIYWNLETGKPIWIGDTDQNVMGVAISPDGRTALSAEWIGELNLLNLWDLETGNLIRPLKGHTNIVWSAAFVDDHKALSASDDGTVILWDLESGVPIRSFLGHSEGVRRIVLSPDKRLALSVSRDGTAILWDVESGEPLRHYAGGHTDQIYSVAWSPDGKEALTGGTDFQIIRWRIDADLESFLKWVEANRYVPALTCADRSAFHVEPLCNGLTDAAPDETVSTPTPVPGSDQALLPPLPTLAPLDTLAAPAPVASDPAGMAIWGANQGAIPAGEGQVWAYAGQAGERLSIRVAADRPANRIQDVDRQRADNLLDPILAVYSPDGDLLAQSDDLENGATTDAYLADLTLPQTGLYRIEVRSYRDQSSGSYRLVLSEPRRLIFKQHVQTTSGLAIHPDGRTTLVGVGGIDGGNQIRVLDLGTGEVLRSLEGHANLPDFIAISPDGLQALSTSEMEDLAILWDLQTGAEIRRLDNQGESFRGVLFLPDGHTALTASDDSTLALWDLASGEVIRRFEGHEGPVLSLALSPDGETVYSTSLDGTVRVWNFASGEQVASYQPFGDDIPNGLAISPDGEKLLVGKDNWEVTPWDRFDGVIAVLDAHTGEILSNLTGHTSFIPTIAISPDGRYALSGSPDLTVRLWEVSSGKELAVFDEHTSGVIRVAFSLDGLTGYSTAFDGTLRVWDLREFLDGD
jgi:WD40 repeat protein/class 3 adenylate cyclase